MPSRPSLPNSVASSTGKVPASKCSATTGLNVSLAKRRTTACIARSSSGIIASVSSKSTHLVPGIGSPSSVVHREHYINTCVDSKDLGSQDVVMKMTYPAEVEQFRQQVRAWLEENLPDGWFDGLEMSPEEHEAFRTEW